MATVPIRDDSDRYVLLLEDPTLIYKNQLEGHKETRFHNQIDKFLDELTPASAFEDEDKFPDPIRQLKDRGGKVRALGVWCQGSEYDLLIIQVLFDKDDEESYYAKMGSFQNRADQLKNKFGGLTHEKISAKIDQWRERDDLLVFTPRGCP